MSHPIARRAGMLALTAAMLMPSAGALSDVSNWAQEGVAAAQNAGLAPSSLSDSAASGSITRAEFCAVALNAYKAVVAARLSMFRAKSRSRTARTPMSPQLTCSAL